MDLKQFNRIHIVRSMYLPNSAVNNRMMGHIRAFLEAGFDVEAAFIRPNPNGVKNNSSLTGVSFYYCWGDKYIHNRFLNALFSYLWAWKYVRRLPSGSNVLLLGADQYLYLFVRRKDIIVSYETTEYPELFHKGWSLKHYLKNCLRCEHIFVISRALSHYFRTKGIPGEKMTIVNMTVDPVRFDSLHKTQGVEEYIAYCGTASNNKDGVDELLKAFAITHKQHPGIKLYIIGSTPDKKDSAGNLRLIRDLEIEDFVVFTGVVNAEQMPQLLTDAYILALDRPDSLQAQYGFPTKLGEYLLTGNPVIVTRVGDIPCFLKDGESALLCNQRDAEDFSSKLNWALEHRDEVQKIGAKGREVALKSFNCLVEGKKIIETITSAG